MNDWQKRAEAAEAKLNELIASMTYRTSLIGRITAERDRLIVERDEQASLASHWQIECELAVRAGMERAAGIAENRASNALNRDGFTESYDHACRAIAAAIRAASIGARDAPASTDAEGALTPPVRSQEGS